MALDDQLRGGTLTKAQFDALEQRVDDLEQGAQGDSGAVPSQYTINQAGEVTEVVNETINQSETFEEGEEGEEAEEDLLVWDPKKKRLRKLKKGKPGTELQISAKGRLKWGTDPEGGGASAKSGVAEAVWGVKGFGSGGLEIAHGLGALPGNVGAVVSARNLAGKFLGAPGCWVELIEVTKTLLEVKVWSRVERAIGEASWVFWRVE
jgi:hypothetical protein